MNRNHHCINLQYYSSNIGISLALSSSFATIAPPWSCLGRNLWGYNSFFSLSLCGSQKNFPRWQNGRITKNRRVDTVVMRRNDQNSHLSTASANIRHSLRIWSSLFVWFSLSRRPLTTLTRSSWSSSTSPPGQSILITSSLEQVGLDSPDPVPLVLNTLTLSLPSEGLTVSPTPPKKVSSSAWGRRPWGMLPLAAGLLVAWWQNVIRLLLPVDV